MIPQKKIEQAAELYVSEAAVTGSRTNVRWGVADVLNSFQSGVRFAESEIGQTAQDFAEWINENRYYAILSDSGSIWRCGTAEALTTAQLFAKFEAKMV